jgi:rRNA maturation endonuclease Nob1
MKLLLILIATVAASISPGAFIAVILLLALIVICVSLWFYRRSRIIVVKRCPHCNTALPPNAQYCLKCGSEVPVVTNPHDTTVSR